MVYFHCVLDYHDSHLDEFVGKIFYDIHFTCINFLCIVFIHQIKIHIRCYDKNIAKLYVKKATFEALCINMRSNTGSIPKARRSFLIPRE